MKKDLIASLNTYELVQRNILIPLGASLARIADANAGIISNLREKLELLDGEPDANSQNLIDAAFNQLYAGVDNINHAVDKMNAAISALQQSTPLISLTAEPFVGPLAPIDVDDEPTDFM